MKTSDDRILSLIVTSLASALASVDATPALLRQRYGARACRRVGIDDAAQEAGRALAALNSAIAQIIDDQRLIDVLIPPKFVPDDDDVPF